MIVVFGSINVDLLFAVESLPRAGETVLCPHYRAAAGGKGLNQAVAAGKARTDPSMPVRMVGCVGNDGFAETALRALEEAHVGTGGILRGDRPTGSAAVIVDRAGENQITVASGANMELAPEALPDAWLGPETVLVLQMEVPLDSNRAVIERAKAQGARVVLNLAPAAALPAASIRALDLLVVNEIEVGMLARTLGENAASASARDAASALAKRYGVATIVSLGAAGACAFSPEGAWACGALPIQPVDTVGAGDAFVGGLALGLAARLALPDSLRRASVGAGLACTAVGAAQAMPDAAAIDARLGELAPPQPL